MQCYTYEYRLIGGPLLDRCISEYYYITGLRPFGTFDKRVLDLLTFFESTETVSLNGTVMDEYVSILLAENKAVSFLLIKPFHSAYYAFFHGTNVFVEKTLKRRSEETISPDKRSIRYAS